MPLRPEIMLFARSDGRWDAWDPVLERVEVLTAQDVASPGGLWAEGPTAASLRERAFAGRRARVQPTAFTPSSPDWSIAAQLPAIVRPEWRQPERWRRLSEDFRANEGPARLPGLLDVPPWALTAPERLDTARVRAWRHRGGPDALVELFGSAPMHALLSALLGAALPATVEANLWRMGPGDGMEPHPDGANYAATFSVGLCDAWGAANGGAIAFGDPVGESFVVAQRWLPHRGDALVFAPSAHRFHAVEPVLTGERWSWTGWYVHG